MALAIPRLAASLLLTLASALSAAESPILIDRIVAVVDEDPILLSEVEEVIGLGLAVRRPGESDAELRERVVDGLIEQRLRFHEVDRSGYQRVPVAEIEARMADIAAAFPDRAAFRRRLGELGMTEEEVRQLVARQLAVLTYVTERLGARVFVGFDDIRAHYQETLVPDLERRGEPVPPLDEVREAVRAVLHEQRLNQELERWTEELRAEADVLVFPAPPEPLPPVVDAF
jgi:parvulin-like peptidyl-prolyl isomerase